MEENLVNEELEQAEESSIEAIVKEAEENTIGENTPMENMAEEDTEEPVSKETVTGWKAMLKKAYNYMGISLFVFFLASTAIQLAYKFGIGKLIPDSVLSASAFTLLGVLIPIHIIGFGIYFLMTMGREKKVPEKHAMGFGKFIQSVFMTAALCGIGAIVGFIVNLILVIVLTFPFKNTGTAGMTNSLGNIMLESNFFLRILVLGITAPIAEEMIFRKILIDRVLKYGELAAILISGLLFGMFHGNFSQFFFATMIGMFFAFIYVRTGYVWYSIGLHMAVNLTTSIVTISVLKLYMQKVDEMIPGMENMTVEEVGAAGLGMIPFLLLLFGWLGILLIAVTVGIVFWIITLAKKKLVLKKAECQVPYGFGNALGTVGIILFLLSTVVLFFYQYGSIFIAAHKG